MRKEIWKKGYKVLLQTEEGKLYPLSLNFGNGFHLPISAYEYIIGEIKTRLKKYGPFAVFDYLIDAIRFSQNNNVYENNIHKINGTLTIFSCKYTESKIKHLWTPQEKFYPHYDNQNFANKIKIIKEIKL
jgi:hypothetical protein